MNHEPALRRRGPRLFVLAPAASAALDRIDAALERLERGTFGACASCAGPIERARLEEAPETERCGGCAARP